MFIEDHLIPWLLHHFMYVGAGFYLLLLIITTLVWLEWLGDSIVECIGRRLGWLKAASFYCGLFFIKYIYRENSETINKVCGRLLYIRFQEMMKDEPEISKAFLQELKNERVCGDE